MKMPSGNNGIELPAMRHSTESPNPKSQRKNPEYILLIGFGHKVINVVLGHIWMDVTDWTG